jgi:hypothetical protein
MRVAAIGALVEFLLASPAYAAPDARSFLRAAANTMGRLGGPSNIEAIGRIDAEGRSGDHEEVVRPRDGAFRISDRYTLFTEGEGFDGRQHWKLDRSGATHLLNAPFTMATTITEAWVKRRGYLQPGSARLETRTREQIGDRWATVLTMRPRGGNAVRLAFDEATHLLVRAVWDRPFSTITETYGDYRSVGGFKMPFKVQIEESGDRAEISIERYSRLKPSSIAFARPRPPADTAISGPATLPMDALSFAVVPATINGHQYDFILDTGGHNIITPSVADALGLTGEGKGSSGGSGEGRVATSDTRISELRLGSATMTDQHFTILDLDGAVKRKGKPDIAGILGLEVFERMAVTIDEPHNRLSVEPSRPGRVCEGERIPLLFDDDQPAVRGTIDGIPAQIGIDVGNGGIPIVLWRWAEAHKVADRYSNGIKGEGHGVGGSNVTFRTPHHDIAIGKITLRDVDVNYATSNAGYFSSRSDSMNLGHALLQKYVVRFDYAQGNMCVMVPKS